MFQIARMGNPSEMVPAFERDIRRIERLERGTALNEAVVLERDKKQRREKQQQDEQPEQRRSESEPHLHVYTAGATETNLDQEKSDLSVVA